MSVIIDATLRCNGCGHEVPVKARPSGALIGDLPPGWTAVPMGTDDAHRCDRCNNRTNRGA